MWNSEMSLVIQHEEELCLFASNAISLFQLKPGPAHTHTHKQIIPIFDIFKPQLYWWSHTHTHFNCCVCITENCVHNSKIPPYFIVIPILVFSVITVTGSIRCDRKTECTKCLNPKLYFFFFLLLLFCGKLSSESVTIWIDSGPTEQITLEMRKRVIRNRNFVFYSDWLSWIHLRDMAMTNTWEMRFLVEYARNQMHITCNTKLYNTNI